MKKGVGLIAIFVAVLVVEMASCAGGMEARPQGDLRITVIPGEEWIHAYGALVRNAPQIAIWLEDESGAFLHTVYVTRKAATAGWVFNRGNRRVEALPVWMHKRNVTDESGILLPSENEPLVDGITGATPKKTFEMAIELRTDLSRFRVILEVNHSTDFNATWPENAREGDINWTGGTEGSGQPSLVYSTLIDLSQMGPWTLTLDGHGSPDGLDGAIQREVSHMTTALDILETVSIEKTP